MRLRPSEVLVIIADFARPEAKRKRGPYVPPQEQLYPRRLHKYINFYDLGQINTGTAEAPVWVTNPYVKVPALSFTGGSLSGIEHFYISDWEAMEAEIFAVPLADWTQEYRKLDYETAERYGVDVVTLPGYGVQRSPRNYSPLARPGERREKLNIRNPEKLNGYDPSPLVTATNWTRHGLKVPPANYNLFALLEGSMFPATLNLDYSDELDPEGEIINIGGAPGENYFQVTTVRGDLAAPAFSIDMSRPSNVFLMPEIFLLYNRKVTDGGLTVHWLNLLFVVPGRELFLNNQIFQLDPYEPSPGALRYPFEGVSGANKGLNEPWATEADANAAWEYQLMHPDVRYKICDGVAGTVTDGAPASYPKTAGPTDTVISMNQRGLQLTTSYVNGAVFPWAADPFEPHDLYDGTYDQTRLIMVVNQDDAWYYIYTGYSEYSTGMNFALGAPV